MGVDLLVFSNHKLKTDSFKNLIDDINERLRVEIENSPFKERGNYEETASKGKIKYFTDFEENEKKLERIGEIEFFTNYKFCFSIRVFQNTIMFCPQGFSNDWYNWKRSLSNNDQDENRQDQSKNSDSLKEYWNYFHQFISEIIIQIGGNKIVFFDDHTYQVPEDLFYEGKLLEEIIPELKKNGKSHELEKLFTDFESIDEGNYWFIEKIKKKEHNIS